MTKRDTERAARRKSANEEKCSAMRIERERLLVRLRKVTSAIREVETAMACLARAAEEVR